MKKEEGKREGGIREEGEKRKKKGSDE